MKNFLQKQREVIAILAYVLVAVGLVYLAILPTLKKIGEINDQAQEAAMKQEVARQHISQLPRIQKQYETLQQDGDLSGVLLDKDKAVLLIEKLEKMAEQSGNSIEIQVQDSVDPKKVVAKNKGVAEKTLVGDLPGADFLQLKINLTGKYESIVGFVNGLERFEYYCDIIGIQIKKSEEAGNETSNQPVTFGVANPFAQGTQKVANIVMQNNKDMLSASLDTAFYVKQN